MKLPTLYKRTTTGKIQEWTIEVESNKYRTISGQVDGKKVTSEWTLSFGKNEGKANATSPEQQAIKEAKAKWKKQTEKHYHQDIADVDKLSFYKPMLASKYEDRFDASQTWISQPKLDGIRCIANRDGLWTRNGKPIVSVPHIFEELKPLFDENPALVLDGEIYNHDLKDDFERLISLAKKTKPTDEDLEESKVLQYWIYDIPSSEKTNVNRVHEYYHLIKRHDLKSIICTPSVVCPPNSDTVDEVYGEYLEDGFEGQMLRAPEVKYENKRSKTLLKRKQFIDEEFTIVSLNEGIGNYSGMIKSLTLTDGEVTFNAGIKGNQEYLKNLINADPNDYVGKEATVRYQNRTSENIPRFPVVYAIHVTERW